jgi:hypothetical protein
LARKQHASLLIIEDALPEQAVVHELDALDAAHGGGGTAEAITIAFFASHDGASLETAQDEELIGALTVVNYKAPGAATFSISYVFEAAFRRPASKHLGEWRPLLNNFVFSSAPFEVRVRNRSFQVNGTYFSQQNEVTHRCAQSSLRMALNTISPTRPFLSANDINKASGTLAPASGLTVAELAQAINTLSPAVKAIAFNCTSMKWDEFATRASAFAESGVLALIVFSTGGPEQHVVTSFGYTMNTDEWHPHGLAAYSGHGSAPFYPSALWTDHLVIHDDNFGPYYTFTMSKRALEMSPTMKARWMVALAPKALETDPVLAQTIGAMATADAKSHLVGRGKWDTYLRSMSDRLVHRVTLVERCAYLAHLATEGHDGSKMTASEISNLSGLPDFFWMVEFSTVELFTGNHTKLGEVLVDAVNVDLNNWPTMLLAVRWPGVLALRDTSSGTFATLTVSSTSHMNVLSQLNHGSRW